MRTKLIIIFTILVASFGLTAPLVQAEDIFDKTCANAKETRFCDDTKNENNRTFVESDDSLLVRIAKTITFITGAVSVIMIIVGGFRYVISNGDSNGVQGAKNTILYAIVGLIVAIFSQLIVSFVLSRFL